MSADLSEGAALAEAIFVSDVHLSAQHPRTVDAFVDFLHRQVAGRTRRLYLLGDLFEYWAGDDDLDEPLNARIAAELHALSASGMELYFIAGNRDLLIGTEFSKATGVTILGDPERVVIAAHSLLLAHGDALCTDDVDYQKYRAMVRVPAWQAVFLAKPLAERKAFIAGLREKSQTANLAKSAEIMDVNPQAVTDLFASTGETLLIHGHTHRPATHVIEVAGLRRERRVLTDWDADANPPRGGGLLLDRDGLHPLQLAWQHRGAAEGAA